MTHRSRPARTKFDLSVDTIRARRAARRTRLDRDASATPGTPAAQHPTRNPRLQPNEAVSPLVRTEPPVPSSATGYYFEDLVAERDSIKTRISALQDEIAREENDLAAINILLKRAKATKEQPDPAPRKTKRAFVDVIDAEFEVLSLSEKQES